MTKISQTTFLTKDPIMEIKGFSITTVVKDGFEFGTDQKLLS